MLHDYFFFSFFCSAIVGSCTISKYEATSCLFLPSIDIDFEVTCLKWQKWYGFHQSSFRTSCLGFINISFIELVDCQTSLLKQD